MLYSTTSLALILMLLTCSYTDQMELNASDQNATNHEDWTNGELSEKIENCSNYTEEKTFKLLKNGSLFLPHSNNMYAHGDYYVKNETAFICLTEEWDYSYELCNDICMESSEFKLLENGSIYMDKNSKIYGPRDYYVEDQYVCIICEPSSKKINSNVTLDSNQTDFSESFTYITRIGLIISIISLLAHLTVFCFVPSVRNLPGYCLASLSLSLLVAYLCFMALGIVETSEHCANLGLTVYYFFLTSFFWMNVIAFDIYRSFRTVLRELRISSHAVPWRRFLLYSLYSWLVPGILATLVKVADNTDWLPTDYKPSFSLPVCWFGKSKALLVFFVAPLALVMLLNFVFFLDITYVISRATMKTSQSHDATLKKSFFMFTKLAFIMGLTWIVGLVAGYANNQYVWYLFTILNTLQGLFIFIVFSFSSKVRGLCFKKHTKDQKSLPVQIISESSSVV